MTLHGASVRLILITLAVAIGLALGAAWLEDRAYEAMTA